MTRNQLWRRIRALHKEERGFSLVETIVAITVIFGSLSALVYTATIGFAYGDLARQRTAASGIANQMMEDVRGLPYDVVAKGMLTSDVSGDTQNIKSCGSPAVYRFLSCTAGTTAGSGEQIVNSTTAVNPSAPIVPHRGTIVKNNISYSWGTYVTNNCPVVNVAAGCSSVNPFRVTVRVTWTGGRAAPNKLVQIQSLFFSPTGCRSTSTHPFATPCQPFYYAEATVPQGQITVTPVNGGVQGIDFDTATLLTGSVEVDLQQEQLSQVQGGYIPVGVKLVDATGTQTGGGVSETTTAADADPGSTSVLAYASRILTPPATATVSTDPSLTAGTRLDLISPSGDTARADVTTSASATNICPPSPATAEADALPCGYARQQQGANPLDATLFLNGFFSNFGSARLARVAAAGTPNTVFGNRVVNPTSGAICSPATTMDGCLEQTATRIMGTITLGGLPSTMTAPAGGLTGWLGGFLRIVGYADTVGAAVGKQSTTTNIAPPTANITSGSGIGVGYYTGSGYIYYAFTSNTLNNFNFSRTFSQTINGNAVVVTMATVPTATFAGSTSLTPSAAALSQTQVSAQATPPKIELSYQIQINGLTVVDLLVDMDLRSLEARGVYGAAPAQGS